MQLVTTLPLRIERKPEQLVGLVPTMGFLHDGHASLIKRARVECDIVVLSIFVNPLQFGPNEDFGQYPRNTDRDLQIAEACGVDYVFMPAVEVMYPEQMKTTVSVSGVTDRLCGTSRPGHFDGVATIVSKLFNIVKPDKAYFGLKDAQQIAVIEQMVHDLNIDVDIVPCPILREADGLALSSRNVYLSPEERRDALVLVEALNLGEALLKDALTVKEVRERMTAHIQMVPSAHIDYVEILTYPNLEPLPEGDRLPQQNNKSAIIIALAVRIGKTRLIDNQIIVASPKSWKEE